MDGRATGRPTDRATTSPPPPPDGSRRPTIEHVVRPRTARSGLDVFAVEDRTAQLVWSAFLAGPLTVTTRREDGRPTSTVVEHPGGPGALALVGLEPGAAHTIEVRAGGGTRVRRRFRTLANPPGEELFRFATVNDLHLGREEHASEAEHPHPLRRRPFDMADDALREAVAWGARLVVVKGDVCDQSYDRHWDQAADLFGRHAVEVVLLPGNHDTGALRRVEPEVAAAARGLRMTRGVDHLDVDGLRIVSMESGIPGNGWGQVARHAEQVADLVADGRRDGRATFVATHHQAQSFRVPHHWPHGIPAPDAERFARQVRAASRDTMLSSGHTHRCRRRTVEGLEWSEVAATNHFPAVWAGYRVFSGGLMQVVRRTVAPASLAWSEHGRTVLGGVWALWAIGTLSQRCFTLRWDEIR